ncbi:MAG: siderophore-interacting protein [Deltaproteobacteria bacterium]|nr:siderophore-interacting protein [Deltaproteobacteria bacterium]
MSSGKGRILSFFGGLVLTEATITHNEALGPYRRLSLRGEGLQAKTFEPGDKLQLLLPGDDVRTYTPITWARGETSLLVYLHGETTPAPRWAQAAAPGDILRFVGPQRSLSLPPGPVVLIGDETSIAVAAALHLARPGQVKAALSVADEDAARAAAAAVGLPSPTLLARGPTQTPTTWPSPRPRAPPGRRGGQSASAAAPRSSRGCGPPCAPAASRA